MPGSNTPIEARTASSRGVVAQDEIPEPDVDDDRLAESGADTALVEADGERPGALGAERSLPEPTRSPAEAFAELASQISQARRDIAQVADYARGAGAQLRRAYDDVFLEGADAAVRGLIRIDELLFKQTRESASYSIDPEVAALAAMLGQALEGELRSLEVHVLEPQPGDDVDLGRMVAIANRPAPLLRGRRVGTVAEVVSRGYVFMTPHRVKTLKKAEVVIWRARNDIDFGETGGREDAEADRGGNDE